MFKLIVKSQRLGVVTHIFDSLTEINTYLEMLQLDERNVIVERVNAN